MWSKTFGDKKICGRCKKLLPLSDFRRRRKNSTVLQSYCQKCNHEWGVEVGNPNRNKSGRSARYSVEYKKKHPEKQKQWARDWYKKHREKYREWGEKFRRDNPEYMKEKGKEYFHNRRSRLNGLPDGFSKDDWKNTLDTFGGLCGYCGREVERLARDHFIPVLLNGGYILGNIVPACRSCNSSKGHKSPEVWVIRKFGKAKYDEIVTKLNQLRQGDGQVQLERLVQATMF